VLGNTRPKDRSEEEIQGYRNALQRIHAGAEDLPVTPASLREMHRTIQEGGGDAGQWKTVDNDIIEFRPGQALREKRGKKRTQLFLRQTRSHKELRPPFFLDVSCSHPAVSCHPDTRLSLPGQSSTNIAGAGMAP
jgi:hypothetical protein